jgi:hypothetical protein
MRWTIPLKGYKPKARGEEQKRRISPVLHLSEPSLRGVWKEGADAKCQKRRESVGGRDRKNVTAPPQLRQAQLPAMNGECTKRKWSKSIQVESATSDLRVQKEHGNGKWEMGNRVRVASRRYRVSGIGYRVSGIGAKQEKAKRE